jgi:hypothetical protein
MRGPVSIADASCGRGCACIEGLFVLLLVCFGARFFNCSAFEVSGVLVANPRQKRRGDLSTCSYFEWRAKAVCREYNLALERTTVQALSVVPVVMRPVAISMEANAASNQRNDANVSYVQSFNH